MKLKKALIAALYFPSTLSSPTPPPISSTHISVFVNFAICLQKYGVNLISNNHTGVYFTPPGEHIPLYSIDTFGIDPTTNGQLVSGNLLYQIDNPTPGSDTTRVQITFHNEYPPDGALNVNITHPNNSTNPVSTYSYIDAVVNAVNTNGYYALKDRYIVNYQCRLLPDRLCAELINYDSYNIQCQNAYPMEATFLLWQAYPKAVAPYSREMEILSNSGFNKDTPLNDLQVLGNYTNSYNCFAWSLGITDRWIQPFDKKQGVTMDQIIQFYRTAASSHGGSWYGPYNYYPVPKESRDGVIDVYGIAKDVIVHAAVEFTDPDLGITYWSSKLGDKFLVSHDRDRIQGGCELYKGCYGSWQNSFAPDVLGAKNKKPFVHPIKPSYSYDKLRHLELAIKEISLEKKELFEKKYDSWITSCLKHYHSISVTYLCAKVKEFHELIALGKDTIPLYIQKMLYGDNFFALVPYEAIQQDNHNFIVSNNNWMAEQDRAIATVTKWFNVELSGELNET